MTEKEAPILGEVMSRRDFVGTIARTAAWLSMGDFFLIQPMTEHWERKDIVGDDVSPENKVEANESIDELASKIADTLKEDTKFIYDEVIKAGGTVDQANLSVRRYTDYVLANIKEKVSAMWIEAGAQALE